MDIKKLFPVGYEFKALVVFNPKHPDPKKKIGFEPQFIPQHTRIRAFYGDYSYEDWYGIDPDLDSGASAEFSSPAATYMVIFRIENLGDAKLALGEEWKIRVVWTDLSDPTQSPTADGRTKFYVYVNLVERVDVTSDWEYFSDGTIIRTSTSGKALLKTERIQATRKEGAEYRTDKYVIKVTEIVAKDVHLFKNIFIAEQKTFVDGLARRYGSAVSPDALRKRLANIPPAPATLLEHEYVKNYLANTATLNLPVNLKPYSYLS